MLVQHDDMLKAEKEAQIRYDEIRVNFANQAQSVEQWVAAQREKFQSLMESSSAKLEVCSCTSSSNHCVPDTGLLQSAPLQSKLCFCDAYKKCLCLRTPYYLANLY